MAWPWDDDDVRGSLHPDWRRGVRSRDDSQVIDRRPPGQSVGDRLAGQMAARQRGRAARYQDGMSTARNQRYQRMSPQSSGRPAPPSRGPSQSPGLPAPDLVLRAILELLRRGQ